MNTSPLLTPLGSAWEDAAAEEISHLPQTEGKNNDPIHYGWVNVLQEGEEYKSPKPDQPFKVEASKANIKKVRDNFALMRKRGVDVPFVKDHSLKADSTMGFSMDTRMKNGWLQMLQKVVGDKDYETAKKNRVSAGLKTNMYDGLGNHYYLALQHIACTPVPVAPGQANLSACEYLLSRADLPEDEEKTMDIDMSADDGGGHWVTIEGEHVLIGGAAGTKEDHRVGQPGWHRDRAAKIKSTMSKSGSRAVRVQTKDGEQRFAIGPHGNSDQVAMKAAKAEGAAKTSGTHVSTEHFVEGKSKKIRLSMVDADLSRDVGEIEIVSGNLTRSYELSRAPVLARCPGCGSNDVTRMDPASEDEGNIDYCDHCGNSWAHKPGTMTAKDLSPAVEKKQDPAPVTHEAPPAQPAGAIPAESKELTPAAVMGRPNVSSRFARNVFGVTGSNGGL